MVCQLNNMVFRVFIKNRQQKHMGKVLLDSTQEFFMLFFDILAPWLQNLALNIEPSLILTSRYKQELCSWDCSPCNLWLVFPAQHCWNEALNKILPLPKYWKVVWRHVFWNLHSALKLPNCSSSTLFDVLTQKKHAKDAVQLAWLLSQVSETEFQWWM